MIDVASQSRSLRILFLNQFFWPDAAPTGQLLADVCHELVAQGHQVDVLCGQAGYERVVDATPPPATIHRTGNFVFSRSSSGRLLSWLSFLLLAAVRSVRLPKYDIVVAMTTPPGLSYVGWLIHRLQRGRQTGAKFWIWEMDLYPDVAVGVGSLAQNGVMHWLASALMDWPRHRADQIIALGECMRDRLIAHRLAPEKVLIAENWVDGELVPPQPVPAGPPFSIFYSGNLGMAHEIETISGAMLALRDDARIRFVFAGAGARYSTLQSFCRQHSLANVEFLPYQDKPQFAERLAACHAGLVTLQPGCEGTVVPSKTYSIMAAGRPLLFIGPEAATPACYIRKFNCGWRQQTGDVEGTVALLRYLADYPERFAEAGANAQLAFQRHYDRAFGATRLARMLTGATAPVPVALP